MQKIKKVSIYVLLCAMLIMCMSLFAFAKNEELISFTGLLPAKQGDVHVSTVKKEFETVFFTVNMTSINGYSKVCAWTENTLGANYSDPANQVHLDETEHVGYDKVPKIGNNVTLNLDNPVWTANTVSVTGNWSPN